MDKALSIFPMKLDDIEAFCRLARQLGYEANAEYLASRLAKGNPEEQVFVASLNGAVVGWIDCRIGETFLVGQHADIVGLVVDESFRSKGIGSALVRRAEEWVRAKGMKDLAVRSNIKRKGLWTFVWVG